MRNSLIKNNLFYMFSIAAETAAIIFLFGAFPAYSGVALLLAAIKLCAAASALILVKFSSDVNFPLALRITAFPLLFSAAFAVLALKDEECGIFLTIDAPQLDGTELQAFKSCGTCPAGYDDAVYYKNGGEFFPQLFREIENAEKYVYLEYFIVDKGKIFNRLLEAVRTAKKRGAEIKIIIDGFGSALKAGKNEHDQLKEAGAEIKIFRKISLQNYSKLNFRDHRKIAVIDGKTAFIGGFNIADEYANISSPYGFWKDTGVSVDGYAAEVFAGLFLSVWNKRYEMPYRAGGAETCLPYYDSPPDKTGFCESAYSDAISKAERRVHIFTPYFCAGDGITDALEAAAARGVDVRIIIPHIPDKKYAFELSKSSAAPLIKKGVKFFEYTPGFMHAKSMIVDDILFIGSYNFDFRSMRLNYECGAMFKGGIAESAEKDFWECLRLSSPLTENKISLMRKAYRFLLNLFAPLM